MYMLYKNAEDRRAGARRRYGRDAEVKNDLGRRKNQAGAGFE
jgi:hypothetical protein